ncbi:protein of unknown function [Bradyrhizobium vignae]|uniref:Uncharacterized protein n=1 Tax=Bradyrhizobium vignae TaxID=1549949 RepID=A0A2U3PUV4_9BRAD|nr:protein of unknown function [Bradyrhizobium vignae]
MRIFLTIGNALNAERQRVITTSSKIELVRGRLRPGVLMRALFRNAAGPFVSELAVISAKAPIHYGKTNRWACGASHRNRPSRRRRLVSTEPEKRSYGRNEY